MSETRNVARSLNPCIFHLQKLRFELNCALCLNMLNKPMLLPCNHIFCNSCIDGIHCPTCQQRFTDQEIRPASYMENIVTVYKSLDASFNSAILPLRSTDSEVPTSGSTIYQLTKNPGQTAPQVTNDCTDPQSDPVPRGIELTKSSVLEESDMNHAPQVSPGSSPSSVGTKDADHRGISGCRNGGTDIIKSSVGDHLGILAGGMDSKDTFLAREPKRQKKLSYGSVGVVLQSHAHSQKIVAHSDPAVLKHQDCKTKEDASIISSTALLDASCADGSICAFCHSSKITEQTGRLLHYEGGKEVARSEAAFSKTIAVHSKCIEWTPQVYFVDDIIMNLESELVRASKLKCSSCGLKGAALGCFAKSCRRTYHVPCAVDIPDCRWDCDNFLMLCPNHKSIKFPSEKSNSRKRPSGEKCSLSSEIIPEQLNTSVTSLSWPREWILCGSALSSEEKCLVANLTKISGSTMYKFWNPNVTHVIASTDSNGACSRTLKVLMAILNGKWVLSMDWIKACMEANHPVDEAPYEINLDNHGFRDGPRTGRLRASEKAPKLFDGLSFYFNGEFIPSYKSDLIELVRVGGGSIVENMEHVAAERHNLEDISTTVVVYYHDHPQGCAAPKEEAEGVAKSIDAHIVPHTWILESIAACQILPYSSC